MLELLKNTILLVHAEMRTIRRLLRFKAIIVVLTLCLLVSYAISCSIYSNIAPYVPSFVAATPLYLLENVDPVFYLAFQVSALLLAFDIDRRNERNHIAEVLFSKPVSNIQWMIGRVLGGAGLLWIVVATNVIAMQLFGLLSQISGLDIASALQFQSVFVLLVVDAPAILIVWFSLVVFLQSAFRSQIVVLTGVLLTAFMSYLLLQYVPYSFVDLFSPSSNATLFISDVIPEFPSFPSILMRAGSIAFAAMLVVFAAWFYRRQD